MTAILKTNKQTKGWVGGESSQSIITFTRLYFVIVFIKNLKTNIYKACSYSRIILKNISEKSKKKQQIVLEYKYKLELWRKVSEW